MGVQRVVVVQDASRDISSSAIKWAIDGLSLKPGDELTLLGVLHQVNTPSTFSFMPSGKLMGYKIRVDSSTILGTNQKTIQDEVRRKEEEYERSEEMKMISKLYQMKKMKKDKTYFMERLSCGISRMKRNNNVQLLRGPVATQEKAEPPTKAIQSSNIRYNEMLPEQEKEIVPEMSNIVIEGNLDNDDDDVFSLDFFPLNLQQDSYSVTELKNQQISSTPLPFNTKKHSDVEDSFIRWEVINDDSTAVFNCGNWYATRNVDWNQENEEQHCNIEEKILADGLTKWQQCEKFYSVECLEFGKVGSVTEQKTDFTYAELYKATNGFSSKNFLSEGGFGLVFKGVLNDGQWIAVKQHKAASMQGDKEFRSEVQLLSRARHKNVVKLLGSCLEGNHRLLVYEYISNGSLDMHLSKNNPKVLSWKDRMNIAVGAASGLNYLHQKNIIHRDMRPGNILIAHNYEPLLGDFGLARAQQTDSDHSSENKVVGTVGYLAPEYAETGKYSNKTDVYSFGVVLLELITGKTPMDQRLQEKSLVGWARPLLKERKYPELIDERLLDCHDVHQLFWMVSVAEKCLRRDDDKRPSMDKVENALRCIIEGKTANGMEEFSPTRSFSGLSLSSEAQDEQEPYQQDLASPEAYPTKTNNASEQIVRLVEHFNHELPNTLKSPDVSSSGGRRSSDRKRSKSQRNIFYDEMLS
ncbi:hypothetical protein J5N97_014543 [Dioscorea zingiberensis]|uniref:Protein kinase domain-containing protein n=1 Tax=Dioscorea zingiberensis TaxID=325984 RepID=A0A9D5HJR2_9LILI|nr:hypothetical protein J5N97_014543 [Dioscorea zingiberensis]